MATTLKVSLIGFMALSLLATSEAGFPRLHFSGQFLADTSTLNNDPYNYNIDNFNINRDPPCYPNYTFPHCNWNPKGSGDFRLVNCTVTKVCYQNGKCTTQDPIVGKRITGSDDTVAAKMVDLDPYFQMYTSQLWGLVVGVEGAFQGTFKVNTVMDIWQRCKEKGCPGDPGSSGYWSSVLENVSWFSNKNDCPTKTVGTFIDQLKCGGKSKRAKTLNIKFTVDMMNEDPLTHDFAHGRVVGSISSVDNEEALKLGFPEFNRMLWGQGVISAMDKHPVLPEMKDYNHAPFYVDDVNKKVVVDLSNSLPTHLNGTLVDGGNLFLLLVQQSELTEKDGMIKNCEDVLHNPNSNVGSIGYTADEWLMKDAGIVILDIDGQNTEDKLRVMVVKEEAPPCQSCQKQCLPILVEHPEGLYLGAAEDRVFRIPKPTRKTETSVEVEEDGSLWGCWSSESTKVRWSLKVFATEFGKPKQDIMFIVSLSECKALIGLNKPKDAITFVGDNQSQDKSRRKYTTDDRGIAVIEFQTDREGLDCSKEEVKKRREQQVSGQLYVYDITINTKTRDKHERCEADEDKFPPNLQTTTHLYCKHESKEIYYWVDDIYPLFQRYDNLFPVMKPLFSLSSYKEVIAKYRPLRFSLKLALEDPNHMPVTRDLSPADRDMLVKWLQRENQQYSRDKIQYSRDGQEVELAELKANLQLALRFEWTTIPLYLSAYYSIKDGFNTKVASLLKSVVIDEMNHMALVANIINAIGWKPVLNDPEVFPTYPGPLPAGCRPDVAVQLAKCSLHQIHDVFMAIEKPECAGPIQKTISSLETFNKGNAVRKLGGMLFAADNFKDLTAKCREDVKNYEPDTIGALYIHKILCPMIDLSKSGILTFDGDQAKQYPKTINVTNLQTAIKAIHQIIDEGEGGDPCDPFYQDPHGNKTLSHYYKFAEIAHGKALVEARSDHHDAYKQYRQDNHEQETNVCETEHRHDYFTPCDGKICCRGKYEFAGANIPFFENAVWPTLDNPTSSKYPPGSRARKMSDRFNEKYTGLMKCLHNVFNGNPGNMEKCYGLMTSLTVDAKKMVQTPIDPDGNPNVGPNVTPTFEWYPPIN